MKRDSVRFLVYALVLGLYLYFMGWSQFKFELNPTKWLDDTHHQVWQKLVLLYGAFLVVLFLVFCTRKTPKDKYEDLWKK